MAQAFAGLRVLDFTQVLAGPFATQQLAQHGAEVIKIEPPETGDMTRRLMPGKPDEPAALSAAYLTCNIGKKSLTLNMKGAAAKPILQRLAPTADVVVQNFRPGVMSRLGFGYDDVRALRPDVIYCSISGFGQSGPSAHLPAFDGAIQAASGMMSITGHPETGPTRTGYMPVDMATALNAAFAISTALYRRLATGQGQHIDVAMMDTAMVLQAPQVSAYLIDGTIPELFGNRSPTRAPTANVFATSDGHVQVTALKEPQVEAFFSALGIAEQYSHWAVAADRIERTAELNAVIQPLLESKPTRHWMTTFEQAGVPVSSIRDYAELTADPQFAGRPVFWEHPVANGAAVRVVSAAHTTDVDPPQVACPAPDLGEDTQAILADLGFEPAKIAEWRAQGAI